MNPGPWRFGSRTLALDPPMVMGILNVTPDSFSDGGELSGVEDALRRAETMVEAGAGVLDVGGESTRPGAEKVPEAEELSRVIPVIRALASRFPVPISVDTRKSGVARAALDAGAEIVNDVSGFAFDTALPGVVADRGAGAVVMHMRGTPQEMRGRTVYQDLLGEVITELEAAVRRGLDAGIPQEAIVVDPGIGFAKGAEQSIRLLAGLGRLRELGFPIMVGPSRKSFLGALLDVPPSERGAGTVAACVFAYLQGARIFRVHDVRPVVEALTVARALEQAGTAELPHSFSGTVFT